MALIIEDGTKVTGANSYVTTSELTAYATARGIIITGDLEQLLLQSMDYVESLDFIGYKSDRDQALQWPRYEVWIDGYQINSDAIPKELKNGQMEVALAVDAGNSPLADIPRTEQSVTVGPLAVTYNQGQTTTIVRKISASLRKLLNGGSGGSTIKIGRG